MKWLLEKEVAHRFEEFLRAAARPTAEQVTGFLDKRASSDLGCLTVAGDVASIEIAGPLTPNPDLLAWLFFGATTSYREIRDALASAAANPAVKRVELLVDSPGGTVAGLFETLADLEAFEKPIIVRASLAASAAYALAAVAGKIEATTIAAEFGSIGVVATFRFSTAVTVVEVTSTDAPNKRPDVQTPAGQAVIREELDAIHELLVDAIARGRTRAGKPTTVADVNAEFGRGGMFIAGTAKSAGMIDKVPGRLSASPRKRKAEAPELPTAHLTDDARAMSELGARRPGESPEAHADRLCAMADALTPSRPSQPSRGAAVGRDRGDQLADFLCLPTLEQHAERAARVEAWQLECGRQLGLSPEAAVQCDFGPPPRDFRPPQPPARLTVNLGALRSTQRVSPARAHSTGTPDLGDRLADALGLPPDPLERPSQGAASRPPRASKDLGDLMADAMGLPPDPHPETRAAP